MRGNMRRRSVRARGLRAGCTLAGFLALAGPATAQTEPTAAEQLFIYSLNRARHDPPAWAQEFGLGSMQGGDGNPTTLVGVAPRPPLAVNDYLVSSARGHAQEMAQSNYFAHQSAVDGRWPNKMARDAGYPLPQSIPATGGGSWLFPDGDNQTNGNGIESIAAGFGPGDFDYSNPINALNGLFVDEGTPDLGHRVHLLAITEPNDFFREIGAGYGFSSKADYENYWSAQTGVIHESDTFLTGVVYADANGNHLYDLGEGIGGATVNVSGMPVLTNAAGGWAAPVASGTHGVTCSGGSFAGTAVVNVDVSGASREVDCVSGFAGAYVDFAQVPEPGAVAAALAALSAVRALAARRRRA